MDVPSSNGLLAEWRNVPVVPAHQTDNLTDIGTHSSRFIGRTMDFHTGKRRVTIVITDEQYRDAYRRACAKVLPDPSLPSITDAVFSVLMDEIGLSGD
jgi:hypothetical protein